MQNQTVRSEKKRSGKLSIQATASSRVEQESLRFFAMASHEIRSQANTIIGFSELLRDSNLDPEQRDYLEHLTGAARRLASLTSDVTDLARASAHTLRLRGAVFSLSDAVREVCVSMIPAIHKKGLELRCNVDVEVPPQVFGDRQRLQQVLINLIRNAIKFTEKGEVILGVKVPARADRFSTVLFTVSDTGIGISLDRREAIFEPFEQENPGIRSRFGGSGLGLAIARHLVRRMGGSIWVESEPGIGSTFSFMLRIRHAEGT